MGILQTFREIVANQRKGGVNDLSRWTPEDRPPPPAPHRSASTAHHIGKGVGPMQLGVTVTDRITGFKGVVTGYVQYLTGCHQCLVVPRSKPDGSLIDAEWFDEQRLEVDADAGVITLDNGVTPGCDRAPPKR